MNRIYQIKLAAEPPDSPEADELLRFCATDGSYFIAGAELAQLRAAEIEFEVLAELAEADVPVRFFLPHDGAVCNPPPEAVRLAVLARLLAEGRADGDVHVRFLGRNRSVPADGFQLDVAGGQRSYAWQLVPSEEATNRPGLHERFRALRARLADPDTRVVLSLGSGGVKLFCHAPAIRLLETIGCMEHVDEIWGTSAGAMAGLLYSQGLSPQSIEQLGYDLYAGRVSLVVRPSKLQLVRHVIRDALMPGSGGAQAGFVDCARGMARLLDRYCADTTPQRPFYAIAFNLRECRPEVLTPEPVPEHLAEVMSHTDARDAALASSTVPLMFIPRVIQREQDDVHYIDGSTTEDVPLCSPLRKWDLDRSAGAEKRSKLVILTVKLTGNLESYRSKPRTLGKLRLLQTVIAASIEHTYRRDLELLHGRPDVSVYGMDLMDARPDFFETRNIPDYVRAAKEVFPDQLAAIERELRAEEGE